MELLVSKYSSLEEGEPFKYVLESLEKNPLIERIVFKKDKVITYSKSEVQVLKEYLEVLSTIRISLEKSLSSCKCKKSLDFSLAYSNPSSFYSRLKKELLSPSCKCDSFLNTLSSSLSLLENTRLINPLKDNPSRPASLVLKAYFQTLFSSTLYYSGFKGEVVEEYYLGDNSKVTILNDGNSYFYIITPIELVLNEAESILLNDLIKEVEKNASLLLEENPRKVVGDIVRKNIVEKIKPKQRVRAEVIPYMVDMVIRNTIGYGILETVLQDENVQDIYVNREEEFIYLTHSEYEEVMTNILPSKQDIEEWATKIKLENNKPLDESHPVLDGNIFHKRSPVRVSMMHPPLSTKGISISIRKHREIPITLPFLVKENTLSAKSAAYLSIISLFGRSLLIAGSRGSGKTTLLGSLMFELPPKYRMVVVEDTLELPIDTLRKNNYNIVSMKSKSFLSISEYDVEAQDALRASLRFGDSCLIIGEARGREVIALYEAMRVGALSNFVGGTLHAESPYGVYDRVVNDLGVKKTSFKATDVIVILSLLKGPSSLKRRRKLISITEVNDNWNEDPEKENAFMNMAELRNDRYSYSFKNSIVLEKIAKTLPSGYNKNYLIKLIDKKEKQIKDIVSMSSKYPSLLHPSNVIKANSLFLSSINKEINWKKELKRLIS